MMNPDVVMFVLLSLVRDENSQFEMKEGAKSMGAGAATIALAGEKMILDTGSIHFNYSRGPPCRDLTCIPTKCY